jgi:biopolymer transport protein TolR
MGGVSSGPDGLNVDLNLVPFIDLLSSLVLFLLITAVWVQISAIPTGLDSKGSTPIVANQPNLLTIHLGPKGHQLLWPATMKNAAQMPTLVDKIGEEFDLDKLNAIIAGVVKSAEKITAGVSADENIEYGAVVQTIDTVRAGGLDNVALSTN